MNNLNEFGYTIKIMNINIKFHQKFSDSLLFFCPIALLIFFILILPVLSQIILLTINHPHPNLLPLFALFIIYLFQSIFNSAILKSMHICGRILAMLLAILGLHFLIYLLCYLSDLLLMLILRFFFLYGLWGELGGFLADFGVVLGLRGAFGRIWGVF